MINTPYVKHYVDGICINPITKDNPFVTARSNRRTRRMKHPRPFNNKKGIQMVISRIGVLTFLKYHKQIQRLPKGVLTTWDIETSREVHAEPIKTLVRARSITHYVLKGDRPDWMMPVINPEEPNT